MAQLHLKQKYTLCRGNTRYFSFQELDSLATSGGPLQISSSLSQLPFHFLFPTTFPSFCHSHSCSPKFIHSRIYKAPLQEIYSEAPPAQPRRYRSVLSNLQNALSLFLGRIRISKGSP